MSRARRLAWLDVFTSRALSGNPLAVVLDGDGLDDAAMLAFARETGLSETTFVQAAAQTGADYRNRIWDLRQELAFAGHPSLGTAVAVARAQGTPEAHFVQSTPAGLQPVDVRLDDRRARASMLQEPAAWGPELDPGEVLAAVGLDGRAGERDLEPQVVSTGVPQVLVALAEPEALAAVRPDWPALARLLDAHEAIVVYVFHHDRASATVRARSFTHSAAMGEDPATGSAAGPLCAYLHARGRGAAVEIEQGVEMGRPSRLSCSLEGDRVRVAGDVVVLAEGRVWL